MQIYTSQTTIVSVTPSMSHEDLHASSSRRLSEQLDMYVPSLRAPMEVSRTITITVESTAQNSDLEGAVPVHAVPVRAFHPDQPRNSSVTVLHRASLSDATVPPQAALPPYSQNDDPAPAYAEVDARNSNPVAKYLFIYGFVFPLFWFVGAYILRLSLKPLSECECGKSEAQQQVELAAYRRVEVVWAKRCLFASIAFIFAALAVALCVTWYTLASKVIPSTH